jgi:hypothetical protein
MFLALHNASVQREASPLLCVVAASTRQYWHLIHGEGVLKTGVSCPPCLCNHEHGIVTALRWTASQATRLVEGILKTLITTCTTTSVFYYGISKDAASSQDSVIFNNRMISEHWSGENARGILLSLIEDVPCHFPGGTEKENEKR